MNIPEILRKFLIPLDVIWGRATKKLLGVRDGGVQATTISDPTKAIVHNGNSIFNINDPSNNIRGGHYHSIDALSGMSPIELDEFDNDDTFPVYPVIINGITAAILFPYDINSICYNEITLPEGINLNKDIKFKLVYDVTENDAVGQVSFNLDYWVLKDNDSSIPVAPTRIYEDEINPPDTKEIIDVYECQNIKINKSDFSAPGQEIILKIWRNKDGAIIKNHDGDFRLINLIMYQEGVVSGSPSIQILAPDEKVKGDLDDPTAGYLDAKVDNVTMIVDPITHKLKSIVADEEATVIKNLSCSALEQVSDWVRIISDNTVQRLTDNSLSTVFGVITSKSSATNCNVTIKGKADIFGGLDSTKERYFLGTDGNETFTSPVSGKIIELGKAINANTMIVDIKIPIEAV